MQIPPDRRLHQPDNRPPLFSRTARRVLLRSCLPLMGILLLLNTAKAQQGTDYAVQANIIYHFTKYIDWPEDKKSGEFVIGIIGDSPLYDALKSFIGNKMAGSQRIVIKKFSSSAGSYNCHILFVSDDASGSLKKIVTATSGSSLLLVTETDGSAQKGSCINFIIVDDRLKLEINKTNIERRDLNIASELLKLGIQVK